MSEKRIYKDLAGREVHVFEDEKHGEVHITKMGPFDHIFRGEQWCPKCYKKMAHSRRYGVWRCKVCGFEITEKEVEETNGIPSLAAAVDYNNEH